MERIFTNDKSIVIMKILLVVGNANDVFIYNFAKWLKSKMDVSIDVFSFFSSNKQGYDNKYYDNVYNPKLSFVSKIRYVRSFSTSFDQSCSLKRFIKDKHYDVIHCHWLLPSTILTTNLSSHCDKLCATFWGGELEKQEICHSHKLYMLYLKRFLKTVSVIANSEDFFSKLNKKFHSLEKKYRIASLGSATIDELYNLIETEEKKTSKQHLSIDSNKTTVLIGYSGKSLHNHIEIINELKKYSDHKEKIHILAPMTRGGEESYIKQVESALIDSGFSYTLISGRFLSDLEIARIRNATDITLQLSVFDGFSRSIVECLCAKSVLIYGNWLDYPKYLKTYNFSAIAVPSIAEGVAKCCNVVDNFNNYKISTENNSLNGKDNFSWSKCIDGWISIYKEQK